MFLIFQRFFLMFLLVSLGFSSYAQEELQIKTDKAFYASGEKIGVVIAHPTETEPEIIYLEVLDHSSEILSRYTLRSNGKIASCIIDIPLDWESQWYIIRAYTIWIPSIEIKDLGIKAVAIYNEFDQKQVDTQSPPLREFNPQTQAEISSNKIVYSPGEEVQVSVKIPVSDVHKSWVVSVLDKSSYEQVLAFDQLAVKLPVQIPVRLAEKGTIQKKLLYLGRLKDSYPDALIAMYIAEEKDFSLLSLNEEKVFGIELEDFFGIKKSQLISIQALGGLSYLEPSMFYPSSKLANLAYELGKLPYTLEVVDYLKAARKRRIIDNIFNKSTSRISNDSLTSIEFIKADKSYAPADYIRFADTKDFINEVVSFAHLKKGDDGYFFQIMMERNTLASFPPAMFLNGYMLTTPEEILQLAIDQIERIDIYRKESTILKQFKILGRNGVIAFYTKNRNLKPDFGNQTELQGFQKNNSLITPRLLDPPPNFSPRLYWNADLHFDEQGQTEFSFQTSHDKGEYVIFLDCFDEMGSQHTRKSITISGRTP